MLAVALGGGNCNALDKVGHGHFDVEFDEVGQWVELNVSGEVNGRN
jgi:hypothetical protein